MKFILGVVSGLLGRVLDTAMNIAKIEAAAAYVSCVAKVREAFLILLNLATMLLLALAGFVLIHVALFIWLPWSLGVKALLLLILGAAYLTIGLLTVLSISSDRTWMKIAKVDKILAAIGPRRD
jgi:hypothetical protein